MKKQIILLLVFIAILSTTTVSYADFFNQRNFLIGERAAIIGGAYTALSEDVSGAYYNPAALVNLPYSALSINGTAYAYQFNNKLLTYYIATEYRGTQKVPIDLSRSGFISIPNTMGYSYTVNNYFVATFNIFQLDNYKFIMSNPYEVDTEEFIVKGYYKLELESTTYLIGPSLSFKFKKNFPLTFGVSLFLHLFQGRRVERQLDRDPYEVEEEYVEFYTEDAEALSIGFSPIFGLKYCASESLQFGLSYSLETIHIYGNNVWNITSVVTGGEYENETFIKEGISDADYRLPHKLAFGVAYEKEKSFTIAFDVIFYSNLEYINPRELGYSSDPDYEHLEKYHFDISIGSEIYYNETYVIRFGLFTNSSSATIYDGDQKVHIFGGSLGLGIISDIGLSSSFGLVLMGGKSGTFHDVDVTGDFVSISQNRFSIQATYGATLEFLSGDEEEDED